jgi:hypothetical protein
MIAALIAALAVQGQYSWNVMTEGEIVQYGVPQTDDRALRIDCRPGGGLQILGPSGAELPENTPTRVTFRRGTDSITVLGVTVYMGDGINFAVPVASDELPIAALLAGEPITVVHGDASWEVPGAGAAAVLGPLVEACRR